MAKISIGKKFLAALTVLAALFITVIMTGFYPVVLVDNSPIFFSAWQKAEEAQKRFTNVQASSSSLDPIDFASPENKDILRAFKIASLNLLIENKIIEQEGGKIIPDFNDLSKKRLESVMAGEGDLSGAVKTVYGLSVSEFKNLILLPQARRDVLRIFLANEGKNFDDWILARKKEKIIKTRFIPYRWDEIGLK